MWLFPCLSLSTRHAKLHLNPIHQFFFTAAMIFFLISCFSFILLSKSFSSNFKNRPTVISEWRLLLPSPWFWGTLSGFIASFSQKGSGFGNQVVTMVIPLKKIVSFGSRVENVEEEEKVSLLDLPELILESILERLSPSGLCSMAGVCTSLKERCGSDHFWEKHMKQKWSRVIGDAAYREWQCYFASEMVPGSLDQTKPTKFSRFLNSVWPFSWINPEVKSIGSNTRSFVHGGSIMAWYLSLESGKLWFPAQVYNRENGHVGFMLSCYDAKVSYNSQTDTFQARYSPHGQHTREENIPWERLRAPQVDTLPHVVHISDCLHDLKPGDHIEIQWRRNKQFPFGWWYGVVGHLESCHGNEKNCLCYHSDDVALEFNQYTPGSRWRQTMINRRDHREVGDEADGFYGGVRKLYKEEDISIWKRLWPKQVLE
ncbi:F-box protein At2g32560-like [Carica papaya]|uniref:F-box protein At2g32560-like n=1 Tax=Carica papaya TaxID=3649 RepID=UPI000B8CA9E1|nr:F-box protein At2g32560-like [Carica papaya]